jgi:hypothetical protein
MITTFGKELFDTFPSIPSWHSGNSEATNGAMAPDFHPQKAPKNTKQRMKHTWFVTRIVGPSVGFRSIDNPK